MGCVVSKRPLSASGIQRLDNENRLKPETVEAIVKQKKHEQAVEAAPIERSQVLGLLKVKLGQATLEVSANYNVTLSMGLQSFLSHTCTKSASPDFGVEHNVVLQEQDAHVLHLMIHRVKQTDVFKHRNVGHAEVDLKALLQQVERSDMAVPIRGSHVILDATPIKVWDPENPSRCVGTITVTVESTEPEALETDFWHRLLDLVDYDASGTLDYQEFQVMMKGLMGMERWDDDKLLALWKEACGNDDVVDVDELCHLLTETNEREGHQLMQTCPITGRPLVPGDVFGNIVSMTLAMDGGLGKNLQGGYATAKQANRGWMMMMSEWVSQTAGYGPGLNVGPNAGHIIVYDRVKKILTEEKIAGAIVLAMRQMYQTSFGRLMKKTGMFKRLKALSVERGRLMDDPASVSEIQRFIRAYQGQLDVDDILEPLSEFKTFNEFFYRKLKPGARPISHPEDSNVLVSAADCRLMAFEHVSDATRFWIKGSHFSIKGLLADTDNSVHQQYTDGSMVIFRLAPQDYHRFHCPCDAEVVSISALPGQLYTVNPIAVNSAFCDVFTENKRTVVGLQSPQFGAIKYVAIGATMVGSVVITASLGQRVAKGDELGYFAFGGSTVICLFESGRLVLDDDLVTMSKRSIETYVKMGVHIGKAPGTLHEEEEKTYHLTPDITTKANAIASEFAGMLQRKHVAGGLASEEALDELKAPMMAERPSHTRVKELWRRSAESVLLGELTVDDESSAGGEDTSAERNDTSLPGSVSLKHVIIEESADENA